MKEFPRRQSARGSETALATELARTESISQAEADEAHAELTHAAGKAAFSPEKAAKPPARRRASDATEQGKKPARCRGTRRTVRAPEGPADTEASRKLPYPRT